MAAFFCSIVCRNFSTAHIFNLHSLFLPKITDPPSESPSEQPMQLPTIVSSTAAPTDSPTSALVTERPTEDPVTDGPMLAASTAQPMSCLTRITYIPTMPVLEYNDPTEQPSAKAPIRGTGAPARTNWLGLCWGQDEMHQQGPWARAKRLRLCRDQDEAQQQFPTARTNRVVSQYKVPQHGPWARTKWFGSW